MLFTLLVIALLSILFTLGGDPSLKKTTLQSQHSYCIQGNSDNIKPDEALSMSALNTLRVIRV